MNIWGAERLMGLSFDVPLPHLEALAYLVEVIIAERLFLRCFEVREHRQMLNLGGLALMLLLGTATGIPQGSSLARFLWYFLMIAWRVFCAAGCCQGDLSAVSSACMAGFATQHIANKITILIRLFPAVGAALRQTPMLAIFLEVSVFAAVYALVYVVFARQVRPEGGSWPLNVLSCIITILCIGVNRLVVDTAGESVQYEAAVCIYAIIGCVFALILQVYISRWEEERAQTLIMKRLLADSEKQYEQWQSSVEQVNIAVHDIKHMLDRARTLADSKQAEVPDLTAIRELVGGYSASVRTGNDVLDILLRNMSDLCSQNAITLNCTIYTDQLKYFDGMGLYFLFGNAIENAMKGTALVEDPDKRIIDVSVRCFGSSVIIHIWNYYTGKLKFVDGLPVTRDDSRIHGFGMKSMRLIAERFGGVLSAKAEGQVFSLDVMLPLLPG